MPPRTMARSGRERKNPEMMLTILRTAFLAYVRLLLCLQGLYLGFWAVDLVAGTGAPQGDFWPLLGLELLFAFPGLATIATAVLLRPGQRRAAITAVLIEALWATLAAAIAYKTLRDWPLDLHPCWRRRRWRRRCSLVAVVGLLLPAGPRLRRARSPPIARSPRLAPPRFLLLSDPSRPPPPVRRKRSWKIDFSRKFCVRIGRFSSIAKIVSKIFSTRSVKETTSAPTASPGHHAGWMARRGWKRRAAPSPQPAPATSTRHSGWKIFEQLYASITGPLARLNVDRADTMLIGRAVKRPGRRAL